MMLPINSICIEIIGLLMSCVAGLSLRSGQICKILEPDSGEYELQNSGFCPFLIVPTQGYYYKKLQVTTFRLQALKRSNKFDIFNFEILKMDGGNAGIMLPNGGDTCSDGALFSHSEAHRQNSSIVTIKWRAPKTNVGRLRFRYSVGVERGNHKLLWYNCTNAGFETTLKYVREIPIYPTRRSVIPTTTPPPPRPNHNTYTSCRSRTSHALHTVIRGTNCRRYIIEPGSTELTCPGGYGQPRLQFDLRTCSCQFSYLTTCHT